MSVFTSLKLVASKSRHHMPAAMRRRHKLCAKLQEQLELAEAQRAGRTYSSIRRRSVVNESTGERTMVESPKRLREWFWMADNGKIHLAVRYGARVLELAKGRNAVELADRDELIVALTALKTAVMSGELDAQIEAAAGALRAGFRK